MVAARIAIVAAPPLAAAVAFWIRLVLGSDAGALLAIPLTIGLVPLLAGPAAVPGSFYDAWAGAGLLAGALAVAGAYPAILVVHATDACLFPDPPFNRTDEVVALVYLPVAVAAACVRWRSAAVLPG